MITVFLRGYMNLNVPDLRKELRRSGGLVSAKVKFERRKVGDRRAMNAERVNPNKVQQLWLTPHMKTLINDLLFLDMR